MPYGFGLIFAACHIIMHFADRYYAEHKADYSAPEQAVVDALIAAAAGLEAVISQAIGV